MLIYLYSSQDIFNTGGGGKSSRVTYESLVKRGHELKFFQHLGQLKSAISERKPDLVLHHNITDLERVQKICMRYGVEFIPTINGLFTCAKGTHIIGPGFGVPCYICSLKGMAHCALDGHYKMQYPWHVRIGLLLSVPYRYYRMKCRITALNRSSAVIAIGSKVKEILEMNGVKSMIYVCPQPIDDSLSHRNGEVHAHNQILFASGLDTTKGSLVLLRAFRESGLKDWRLVIAGRIYPIMDMADFKPYLSDDVEMLGEVSSERMKELICTSEIVAFPSLLFEPFGRVWAEAACCGKPILGIRGRAGPSDYLADGKEALFADPDIDSLRSALQKLASDPGLRNGLGKAAKIFAQKHLSGSEVASSLESIYKQVLSKDKSSI